MSDSQIMAMRDPETAAILRRQALIAALNRPMDQSAYRSAASPWVAGLQAIANGVNAYMGDRDLRDLGERRNTEANQFMANALAGLGVSGQGGQPAPGGAPQGPAQPAAPVAPRPAGSPSPDVQAAIEEASRETGIPVPLLTAQIRQESGFDPNARGRSGEIGLAQIMPDTARNPGYGMAGVDPATLSDPRANVRFGANYLAARGRHAGVTDWNDPAQQDRALAAYNGGGDPNYAQNVRQWLPQANATPASAPPSAAPPAASPTSGGTPANAGSPAGLNRQAILMQALQGLQSTNPLVRERAQQLLHFAQALPQTPPRTFSTAAPGSYITDNNGNITGRVPEAPDHTLETIADPSSPTGYRRVPRAQAAGQPVAAPGPQVAIDQRGQSAYDQTRGQSLAQEEGETRQGGTRARQTLGRLDTIEQNLNRVRTGAFSGQQIRIGQIANMLGVPQSVLERLGMSPDSVAAGEQVNSLASQMLLGMIGPGGFPANNFSNADRDMLERALPGLANTPQGNRLIIGVMRAQSQRQVEIADAWNQWRRQNGSGMESFDRFQQERLPEITGRDVLAPLLQDAFPVSNQDQGEAVVPGPSGGVASPPPAAPAPPRMGEVRDGYRFRGGNPGDQNSWERVR